MQRSRELAPHATQRNAGLLTACFAIGQLAGPLLAAASSHYSGSLQPGLIVAGSGLLIAGALSGSADNAARRISAGDRTTIVQR
jgi:hypothetical protein